MEKNNSWDYGDRYPAMGYGIYYLQIKNLKAGEKYGLKIPVRSSSYQVWVDSELIATVGTSGKSKETAKPAYQRRHQSDRKN
jgi:hypothetical protein